MNSAEKEAYLMGYDDYFQDERDNVGCPFPLDSILAKFWERGLRRASNVVFNGRETLENELKNN